jgi:hypothetical protein
MALRAPIDDHARADEEPKTRQPGVEADALHFSTDVWSSSVVIAGLMAVSLGQWLHDHSPVRADWLLRADGWPRWACRPL